MCSLTVTGVRQLLSGMIVHVTFLLYNPENIQRLLVRESMLALTC
jgi:hypothetical protein